jgi:hypothetical protein
VQEREDLKDISPVIIVDYIRQSIEILLSIKQEEQVAKDLANIGI